MFKLRLKTRLTAEACRSMGLSVNEVGRAYGLGNSFDTALPQSWVDECISIYKFDPRSQVVWYYGPGDCFGKPFPLTREMEYQFKAKKIEFAECPAEQDGRLELMCPDCETIFRDNDAEQHDFQHIKSHGSCLACAGGCNWCGSRTGDTDKLTDYAEIQAHTDEIIDSAIEGIEAFFNMQGGSHIKDVLEDLKRSQSARQLRKV